MDLQKCIDNHSNIFGDIPKGIPPTQDHDHVIHLQSGSVPPRIGLYRYPYAQKSEIEHMIQEMLEDGIIQPRQSDFSSPVVMVKKRKVHGICVQTIESATKPPLYISFLFMSLMNY